jgi:hypothetical protein
MTPLNADEILDLLADRDCRVAFAAMIANCDGAVRRHRYGDDSGGGTSYLTARGAANATGLDDSTAAAALSRLEAAGLAVGLPGGGGWRLNEEGLTERSTAMSR